MKHTIRDVENGLRVDISDSDGKEEKLLKAFQECKKGHCSCPTDEYQKLEKLTIEQSKDGISLQLQAKKGEEFDLNEIEKCLNYSEQQAKSNK